MEDGRTITIILYHIILIQVHTLVANLIALPQQVGVCACACVWLLQSYTQARVSLYKLSSLTNKLSWSYE